MTVLHHFAYLVPPVFVPSSYTSQLARQPGRVQLLDVGSSFNYIIITAGQQSRYTFALPLPNPRSTRPPPIQHDALKKIPKVSEAGEVSQVDPVPPKNRGYHPRLRSATCASTPTPPHQSKHPELTSPLTARSPLLHPLVLRRLPPPHRRRHQRPRIRLRRARPARPHGRILDQAQDGAAGRHLQERAPARLHAGLGQGD